MNFMGADLFAAQGKALTNFVRLLPEPQSDLANQILKDPYNFDESVYSNIDIIFFCSDWNMFVVVTASSVGK